MASKLLSVIIPARDEVYLQQTIDSVLDNARGHTEVIAITDGYEPSPPIRERSNLVVIHNEEARGQRQSINQAAKIAKGDYIMKLDAHCMVDEGFDVKLAADCEHDWTVVPRMYNLDAENWQRKTHKVTDHMFIRSPHIKQKPFRIGYWNDKRTAREFPEEYEAFKKNPVFEGDIADTMVCVGACFFMHKDRFWELGGCDEATGHWGQQGIEVALKAWLSGGRFVVNKKTWFAHYFRGGSGPGFPWPASGKSQQRARNYSMKFWTSNEWSLQQRDLQWLVDKFAPVPTWNGHEKRLKVAPVTSDITLLYYTANKSKRRKYIENRLKEHAQEEGRSFLYPLVSVSQEPVEFGMNICVGDIGQSLQNIYQQVLLAAKNAKTDYVALVEDDCLYVSEHFKYRPSKDKFAYNLNRWLLHEKTGVFSYRERPVLSQCIAPRELLIECLEKRFELKEIPKKYCGEMGLFEKKLGIDRYKYETFRTKQPNVVICHEDDTSGTKYYGKDDSLCSSLEPWGDGMNLLEISEPSVDSRVEIIKQGKSGKPYRQHSFITSIVFDVAELVKHRMDYVDRRKPQRLRDFMKVYPPYIKAIAEDKQFTDAELEELPYYTYQLAHLNPADLKPLTEKGKRHTLKVVRESIALFHDIKENGLKAPLDMWREEKDRLVLHRGGRRLHILHALGVKNVPARVFKSKRAFQAFSHDRTWSRGSVASDSIHNLAIQQFIERSHKATDKYWVHGYTKLYDTHFERFRDKRINLLEIGVLRGNSLLLWEQAFPKAMIYGLDKNTAVWKKNLANHERIKVIVGRQEDDKFLQQKIVPAGPFDIIVDDGSHWPEQQLSTFERLWPTITEGGIYVIEDLHGNYWARRAKYGPKMIERLQELVANIHGSDEIPQVRSMCTYYNIAFIEKV